MGWDGGEEVVTAPIALWGGFVRIERTVLSSGIDSVVIER